jgi:hypothetical protein
MNINKILGSLMALIILNSCGKDEENTTPDPPRQSQFQSVFTDVGNNQSQNFSFTTDQTDADARYKTINGNLSLVITIKQKVSSGKYQKMEINIPKNKLSANITGSYEVNYMGIIPRPVEIIYTYNEGDQTKPVTFFSSNNTNGTGSFTISKYDDQRKLIAGSLTASSQNIPSPITLTIIPTAQWDLASTVTFDNLKVIE